MKKVLLTFACAAGLWAQSAAQGVALLPRTAQAALDAVEADSLMREALGHVIFPEWLKVKRSEIALYDTAVSEWERKAYLGV